MAGKIKFVKRGGAVDATIPEDDLAAAEWGSTSPDPVNKVRAQDLELPHEINVLYFNSGADYQQGTQKAERQSGSGVNKLSIALPVVLDDTKAKQVADVNLYNAWVQRTTYTLKLSRKWSKIEPTDVIDVSYNDVTLRMRVTKKDDANPGIITLDCVAEDSEIYTQSGTGAGSSNIPTQVVTIPVQTLAVYLDINALRDDDNDAGIYFAACGYRSGWNGCALFKSSDEGSTYNQLFSVTTAATIGYATTALGNFYGGETFDELNSVTVKMFNGTLSSTTELAALNNANTAVLGDEIIQFKNAELVATGTYKLTGLLRGVRGTEWAMGTHAIGERLILADTTSWRRVALPTSDFGLEKLYKAVSFGMTLQQTAATELTVEGNALKPYSVVEIGAGRNAGNDIVIEWTRRNRLNGEWRDYVDVPMSESTESYEIDIMDSTFTTVLRTLTATTNTVTYTIAQQATDYPSDIESAYINIYQISAIVGRGYAKQSTFNLPTYPLSSTKWRVYITGYTSAFQSSLISEIEMNATVGGADQCTGGTATASSGTAADAFDNNTGTWTSVSETSPNWIAYEFTGTVGVGEVAITCADGARAITAFSFQANIGTSWVTVYSTSGLTWTGGERKTFTI